MFGTKKSQTQPEPVETIAAQEQMMNVAYLQTRIELSKAEEKQFYERYIKTMRIKISADGSVNIEFGS